MIMTALVTVVGAYLLGSINFAVIFTHLFAGRDVRDFGSGNAGATNTLRVAGVLPATLTFVCDLLKGTLACWVGSRIFDYMFSQGVHWAFPIYGAYFCGVACMLGHLFPIFFGFRGGKGVAIGVGIYLICSTPAILIGVAVFLIVMLFSRIVSISSIIGTVVVVIGSFVFHNPQAELAPQILLSLTMGIMIIMKHIPNIQRLLNGEEKKISFGGKH